MVLENRRVKRPRSSLSNPGSSRVASLSGSALKYTPYDPPGITPRLRTRRPSRNSGLSDAGQVSPHRHIGSFPMTTDLALAAGLEGLEITSNVILNLVQFPTKKLLTLNL